MTRFQAELEALEQGRIEDAFKISKLTFPNRTFEEYRKTAAAFNALNSKYSPERRGEDKERE